jgi:Polysaccharide deacetylase
MVRLVARIAIGHAPEELRSSIKHIRALGPDPACLQSRLKCQACESCCGQHRPSCIGWALARHARWRRARTPSFFATVRRYGAPPPLERQLRYLRRVFNLVPFAALAASISAARAPARRRQAAIIFDDGLRSNVRVAYPMLRALGIPATFFVCPGLIEERRWLWTHEARRRLQFAPPQLRRELARELGVSAEVEEFVEG